MYNYNQPSGQPLYPAYATQPYPYGYQPQVQPAPQQTAQPQYPQGQQPQQQYTQLPIQNGGFVPVQSEEEARRFPVQPGRCVTFRNTTAPYCYTKTQSYNTFEPFEFKKYRVEEEKEAGLETPAASDTPRPPEPPPVQYAALNDLEALTGDVKKRFAAFESEISELRDMLGSLIASKKPAARAKKEEDE